MASEMFVSVGVNTFKAVFRNRIYKFICRLNASKNEIMMGLSNVRFSTTRYQSKLWKHYSCIFVTHLRFFFFFYCCCVMLGALDPESVIKV